MREIKFRGKRVDNGEWVEGYYFITPLTDESTGSAPEDGWFFLTGRQRHCISRNHCVYEIIPETVGQYTQMNDNDNKEIFEGDILEFEDGGVDYVGDGYEFTNIGIVKYDAPNFYVTNAEGCQEDIFYNGADMKVIGNKYDNPDLIIN